MAPVIDVRQGARTKRPQGDSKERLELDQGVVLVSNHKRTAANISTSSCMDHIIAIIIILKTVFLDSFRYNGREGSNYTLVNFLNRDFIVVRFVSLDWL